MSVPYIEQYDVPGVGTLGIEDYEDGQPKEAHFFGRDYKKGGKKPRYNVWSNGGGLGGCKTLEEARQKAFAWATDQTEKRRREAARNLANATRVKHDLGKDPFNLGIYRVTPRKHK